MKILITGSAGFIGGYLVARLGITAGGLVGRLSTATVGAVVLIFVIRLFKRV